MEEHKDYITKSEHNEFVKRIDAENERQNHRISNLEESIKEIQSLTISVEKMAVSIQNIADQISHQSDRLKAIESKPADNWNKLLWVIGTAVISAVIGYVLRGAGL